MISLMWNLKKKPTQNKLTIETETKLIDTKNNLMVARWEGVWGNG